MKSRYYRFFKKGDYISTCSGLAQVTDIQFGTNYNTGKAIVRKFEVFYDLLLEKHIGEHYTHSCDEGCWPDKISKEDAMCRLEFLIDAYNKTNDVLEAKSMWFNHSNKISDDVEFVYEQYAIDCVLKDNNKKQTIFNMNRFKANIKGFNIKPKNYPKHWRCLFGRNNTMMYKLYTRIGRHKKSRRKFYRRFDKKYAN